MANNVEITVSGKNEATRVFTGVEKAATSSAKTSEKAWSDAMGSIENSSKKAGEALDSSGTSLTKFGDTARASRDGLDGLGKSSVDSGEKLNRLGEASDNVDTRAMGFRDTVTGVSDTLKGLNDASLTTEQRLLMLGMGIGDLGSAGYNLLVPAMSKVKQVISDVREPTSDLRNRMGGLGKSMAGMAAGAAIIAGVGLALDAAFGEKAANVDALTISLRDFVNSGKASGETARLFGGDLDDLLTSFSMLHTNGVLKFVEGIYDIIPGSDLVGVSMSEAKDNVGALDSALANLAKRSPAEASAAFVKLTQEMGLTREETEQIRGSLPQFTTEMRKAAEASDSSAQSSERNAAALADYLTQLQAATDPIFGLLNSLNGVTEAQNAYNEAVKTNGVNSAEAKDASIALAEAVAQAEAAALNGDISYENFSASLDHWVQSGVITAQQAVSIRDRVNEARGSAQSYTGNYNANLFMQNHASNIINQVKRDLDSIPNNTYKNFVMTYIQHIIGPNNSMAPGGILPLGRATGGPIGHAAEGGGRSGLTWVGENGPELVKLPTGSFVNPSGSSSDLNAGGGGMMPGSIDVALQINSGGSRMDNLLVEILRVAVRERGGNVQRVLGNGKG